MAGSLSTACANKVLDHVVGKTSFTMPAALWLAAYTVTPTDAGGGTECSGTGYVRKQVTPATDFAAAGSRAITNTAAVTFATAGAGGWGTVVAIGAFDADVAGNFLWWDSFTGTAIAEGDILEIAIGAIDIDIAAGS